MNSIVIAGEAAAVLTAETAGALVKRLPRGAYTTARTVNRTSVFERTSGVAEHAHTDTRVRQNNTLNPQPTHNTSSERAH